MLLALMVMATAAGEFDGQISADFLRGEAKNETQSFSAQEIGFNLKGRLYELDGRLHVAIDYRGREPVGGSVKNQTLRLLYKAEVGYEVIEDTLTLSAGRFVAAVPTFLPVDALRVDLEFSNFEVSAFGGRRAYSTGRRSVDNVALNGSSTEDSGLFLPAFGGGVRYRIPRLYLALDGAYSRDLITLIPQSDAQSVETFDSFSLRLHGVARPLDELLVGASLVVGQRAGYILGPSWSAVEIDVQSLGLTNGVWFADYTALKWLRFGYRGQVSSAIAFRQGLTGDDDPIQDPNFFDNRITAAARPLDIGWARASMRLRLRNDRRELRYGLVVDIDNIGVKGPYFSGHIFYDDIEFDAGSPDLDRLLWKAALGFRDFGLDAQLGVSFLERTAAPVSGLPFDPRRPGAPVDPQDLSPFVLAAQQVVFVRAFYNDRNWFAGANVERNLRGNETRMLFHAGALWGAAW